MRHIVFYIFLLFALPVSSQKFRIDATVVDYLNGEVLDSVTLSLLNPKDSSVIYTFPSKIFGKWNFKVTIDHPGTYILHFSRKNYEDEYQTKTFNYIKYRKTFEDLGRISLKRNYAKEITLNEVVIKPTQIKMFVKGDTIVYNADAFNLPDGSMLDKLIQMLPGTTLDPNGQIFVNGRKISSLMLNGNNFFQGNPKIALENLPAYTIKNLKVYEKQSDKEIALGLQKGGSEYPLVLDVNLKKQYSIGWMGNVEGGFGTGNHYVGRAFLMRFSSQSRVALFAGTNDINENYAYRSDGQWNENMATDGLLKTTKGGLDVVVNDKQRRFKLYGNVTGTDIRKNNEEYTSSTEFYSAGNIYKKQSFYSEDKNTNLNAKLDFSWTPQLGFYFKMSPYMDFRRFKNTSHLLSIDLNQMIGEKYRGEILNSFFSPVRSSEILRSVVLSTLANDIMGEGHHLSTGTNAEFSFRPNNTSDVITINSRISYGNSTNNHINNYHHTPNADTEEKKYNYSENPIHQYRYDIKGTYTYLLEDLTGTNSRTAIDASYFYSQNYCSDARPFYDLEDSDFNNTGIGHLNSATNSIAEFMNTANTYYSSRMSRIHRPELSIDGFHNGGSLYYKASIPFVISNDRLHYRRSTLDTLPTRTKVYVEPYIHIQYKKQKDGFDKGVKLRYQLSHIMPDLVQTLDYRDESTPLVVRVGTANLKTASRHGSLLELYKNNRNRLEFMNVSFYHNLTKGVLCQSMTYDMQSGVRTYKPQTVNGNWNAGMVFDYQLSRQAAFERRLTTKTEIKYSNNVDFARIAGQPETSRNSVKNTNVIEHIGLMFHKNYRTIFQIDVNAMYTHSESPLFTSMNLFDINCELRGRIQLPWKIEMQHSLNTYIHRGYQDDCFNTETFIWSAYIQKLLLKGKFAVRLEAFDILNQMKNIQYTLTSQMQRETYRNSIRRLIMLKIKYNFTKQPKKR